MLYKSSLSDILLKCEAIGSVFLLRVTIIDA